MGHPLLEEFCRVSGQLRPEFFRRCQRVFREDVNPVYEKAERLEVENTDLKAQLDALQAKAASRRAEKVPA